MLKKKKVFLIHGHDELNLLRLKNYLVDDLQIEAVILKELSTGGNTIIEQFEKMAVDCDHAFAIFTKDDRINSKKDPYLQARPNVLFELGWFYGKLGRKNVTVLFQEGVKIPSDLDGLLRIQFRENILDKSREIKKELE